MSQKEVLASCVFAYFMYSGTLYAASLKPKHFLLSPPTESSAESSLVAELQEKLHEEKMKFLEQLEEQEKRKNEEMQNIRTSLTAEQQVKLILFYYFCSHENYVFFCCFEVMELGVFLLRNTFTF